MDTFEDIDFDYEAVKMAYIDKVNKSSKRTMWNRHKENKLIVKIVRENAPLSHPISLFDSETNEYANLRVDLAKKEAEHVLTCTNSHIQVLPYEDCFDIFVDLHLREFHAGFDVMYPILQKYFYFSKHLLLECFLPSCNVCIARHLKDRIQNSIIINQIQNPSKGTSSDERANDNNLNLEACIMFLGMTSVQPNEKDEFKYLLVYRQEESEYILLRPLLELDAEEVAIELYNIFVDFGPPETIKTTHLNFIKDVLKLLQLTPIKYNCKVYVNPFNGDYLRNKITGYINEWIKKCDSSNWPAACYIVQFSLNTESHGSNGINPMERLFGKRAGQRATTRLSREQKDKSLPSTSKGNSSTSEVSTSTNPFFIKEKPKTPAKGISSVSSEEGSNSATESLDSMHSVKVEKSTPIEGLDSTGKNLCKVCHRIIMFDVHTCTKCNQFIHLFCGLRVAVDLRSFSEFQVVCHSCLSNPKFKK